ncbi:MAG: hypothetical protein K6G10_02355 [Butyrivibrio sp.]|nr:hypothetical protein [Butyrivibrio sp.]
MSVHEEIKEQQKKLKGQGFKAHLEYFWDYYKIHTIVALAIIIVIGTVVHDIATKKPYYLYAMMINAGISDAQTIFEEEFTEYAGFDKSQYQCLVDTSSVYTPGAMDEMTLATSEKIMAMSAAHEIDAFVADYATFSYYAQQDMLISLDTVFSPEEMDAMKDRLYYVDLAFLDYLRSDDYETYIMNGSFDKNNKYAVMADKYFKTGEYEKISPEDMEQPYAVGIYLTDSTVINENGAYGNTVALAGITAGTERVDAAKEFIEFLMK